MNRPSYEAQFTPPTQGLLFPPEVLAKIKVVDRTGCRHPKAARVVGPRVSALFGTFPTTVCNLCWKWTLAVGDPQWREWPTLAARLERDRTEERDY